MVSPETFLSGGRCKHVAEAWGVTQIELQECACTICGEIVSLRRETGAQGTSVALDGRPAGPVADLVQRCPFCGYCAPGLGGVRGLGHEPLSAFVHGPIYQGQLHNAHLSQEANTNLCWALLCRHARQYEEAGRAALRAAWLSDDDGREEAAQWCRERALDMFLQAPSTLELQMLQVDLLRRSGRFEGARTHCQKLLKSKLNPGQTRVLKQQLELIARGDSGGGLPGPGPRKRL